MPSHEYLLSLSKILNKTDSKITSLSVLAALEDTAMLNLIPLAHYVLYTLVLFCCFPVLGKD